MFSLLIRAQVWIKFTLTAKKKESSYKKTGVTAQATHDKDFYS